MRKSITLMIILTLLILPFGSCFDKVLGADNTLKIFMGNGTTARHHKAVAKGEETEELSFELKDRKVSSSFYESTNTSSFRIRNTTKGKCIVEAVNEGTGHVVLTVYDKDGNKYVEKVFISVYTRIGSNTGVVNKNTKAYMGATVNAGVENYDEKGDISKGTNFIVSAQCGDFYIFKTLDGTTFRDGKDTGFIKKSDIDILVNTVNIEEECASVEIGKKIKFSPEISPGFAKNKSISWTINKDIAKVEKDGSIIGNSQGTTICTATTNDGSNKSDKVYVSYYNPLGISDGYLISDCNLYKIAHTNFSSGTGRKNANVEVSGECENFYRIRLIENNGSNSQYFFVEKKNVAIPLLGIRIPETISLVEGTNEQIHVDLIPQNATDANIKWKSSNTNVVMVEQNGKIEGISDGSAVVTAYSSKDETIYSKCRVVVEPYIAVTDIKITLDSDIIEKDTTGTYKVEIFPENATYKKYKVHIEQPSIVGLSGNEYIGKQIGITKIVAETEEGNLSTSKNIEVTPIWVRKIELQKKMDLAIGETKGIYGKIIPTTATNKKVKWTIDNDKIAKVDSIGNVTGISCGKTVLHAVTEDGNYTASCQINVEKYVDDIWLINPSMSMAVGEKKQLKIRVLPQDATKKDIRWRSKNKRIASVNQEGTVISKKPGSTLIIVYDRYSGAYDICVIEVSANLKQPKLEIVHKGGSYTLKWDKQKYATNYLIYEKKSGDKKYKKIKSVKSSKYEYVMKKVDKKAKYFVKAYCKNSREQSKKSNITTIK
ncbi:MAG: Ig-like domain-containing protein [Eubacterium sp.]|nr:Ig-like domain-containing protein [Eubacterium sp.]